MRCFVTGATGFLGRRVVARLRERGHEVRALARDAVRGLDAGVEAEKLVIGDLFATGKIKAAVQGCDAVLHLAAEIATQRDPKKLWKVDVEGTDAVAEACEGLGIQRFVFASTSVVGDPRGAILRPEEPLVATTDYGKAKQEAERRLARSGLPVVVLRPGHIYGPGGWYADVCREFREGRRFIPGRGDNWWDVVHVDDAADAFVRAAELARPGAVFHVADDYPITMREFFDITAAALGVAKPTSVPVLLAKLLRGSGPIDAAIRSARNDNSRLMEQLGWRPAWPSSRDGIYAAVKELERAETTRRR